MGGYDHVICNNGSTNKDLFPDRRVSWSPYRSCHYVLLHSKAPEMRKGKEYFIFIAVYCCLIASPGVLNANAGVTNATVEIIAHGTFTCIRCFHHANYCQFCNYNLDDERHYKRHCRVWPYNRLWHVEKQPGCRY